MSAHAWGLAVANILVLLAGCGLLPILRLARTRWEILMRLPLAYAVGLAATGIVAVEAELAHVPFGRLGLALLTTVLLALGLIGLPGGKRPQLRRPDPGELGALALLAVSAAIAVPAARLAAVKPLVEPDEWRVWAMRAKALYLVGHPAAPVFTDPSYGGLRQPILLPALEALDFRFMGAFDTTLVHMQLFLFAVALVGGAWTLLRPVSGPFLLAASLLAVIAAPGLAAALLTNTPWVTAAILSALGLASLAAWQRTGNGGLLAAAALFLGAATLTSESGDCVALAALAAAAVVAPRARLARLAVPALFVLALDLSWRIWLSDHGIGQTPSQPTVARLWHGLWDTGRWSYLAPLVLAGIAGALILRQFRRAVLVAAWLVLSLVALAAFGSGPAIAAGGLLVGAAVVVPFLLHAGPVLVPAEAPARRLDPLLRGFHACQAAGGWALAHRPRRTTPALEPAAGEPGALPWRKPRRELLLLVLVAAATLTPVFETNTQDASRICLTRAVLHLHLSNTECLTYSSDKSEYGGRLYSDKAPGMSLLEVPAVVIARVPDSDNWGEWNVRLWFVRVTTSGLALILCAFLIGRISEGLAPGYGGISLVAFALGTLVAPLGAGDFEHGTAAMLGLAAFALAWARRPLLAGLVAGLAVLVAYEAAMILAVLAVYLAATRGRRPAGRFLAGTLPSWALLAAYDWAAFGDPWHLSYSYKADQYAAQQSSGFFGIHLPYLHAIRDVFVGRGGLLFISPIVFAAAYGLVLLGRKWRAEAIACWAVVIAFLILDTGYFDPYGGLSPGPRYLIPALPFLALGLGPAFAAHFRLTSLLTVLSIVPEMALMLTWSVGAPDGSIWHHLADLPGQLGSSWIVGSLSGNVLQLLDASRGGSAVFVALAAAAAFALALPLTFRSPAS